MLRRKVIPSKIARLRAATAVQPRGSSSLLRLWAVARSSAAARA
jgi:hypothetical protein